MDHGGVQLLKWHNENRAPMTITKTVYRRILPARWMGHQRQSVRRRTQRKSEKLGAKAWWRPGTFADTSLRAYPSVPLGGRRGHRAPGIELRASYPYGRSWNSRVELGTTWRDYKIALARDMKRSRNSFDILYQGEVLPEQDEIPNIGGAVHIELRKREREPSQEAESVSSDEPGRSRSPSQTRQRNPGSMAGLASEAAV